MDFSLRRLIVEKIDDDSLTKDRKDSLDGQVDELIESFIRESKVKTFESVSAKRTINEADVAFRQKPTGKQRPIEEIDVENFARRVVHLAEHPDDMLEFRDTILRRARNRLMLSYDQTTVTSFDAELRDRHETEIGKSDATKEKEYQPPRAGEAGPISGGGT